MGQSWLSVGVRPLEHAMRFRASRPVSSGVAGEAGAFGCSVGSRLAPVPTRRGERTVLFPSSDALADTRAVRLRPFGYDGHWRQRLIVRAFMICQFGHTRPNHALQRTRPSPRGCNPTPSWAGSLSLGRSASAIGCPRLPPQCHSRSAMLAMLVTAGCRRHGGRSALRGASRDLSPMPNKCAAANRRERFKCYAGVAAAVAELGRSASI